MLVTGAVVPPESKLVLPVFLRLCANNFLLAERGGCTGEFRPEVVLNLPAFENQSTRLMTVSVETEGMANFLPDKKQ